MPSVCLPFFISNLFLQILYHDKITHVRFCFVYDISFEMSQMLILSLLMKIHKNRNIKFYYIWKFIKVYIGNTCICIAVMGRPFNVSVARTLM